MYAIWRVVHRYAGKGMANWMRETINHFTYNFARPSCSPILTSSAIAEGPRDASCQLKSCQLPRNSAETTCTTSPKQIQVMKLESNFMCWRVTVRQCVINMCTQP